MTASVVRSELLLPGPAVALAGLLGVPLPDLEAGDGLPPLWHWFYLLERPAESDLASDGHPARGAVPVPPAPGMRRMVAGARVTTRGALLCGEVATRRTRVLSVQEKQGRSGPLTFVTVGHQVEQGGRVVVEEEQDIVYRDAATTSPALVVDIGPAPAPKPAGPGEWSIDVTPTLLFRFSALTYNGHRIHYDRDYCRDVEGYPGLVTHGPLQALAMAEAARSAGLTGDVEFSFRLLAPLFDDQGLIVSASARSGGVASTAVRDRFGRHTASGSMRTAQ